MSLGAEMMKFIKRCKRGEEIGEEEAFVLFVQVARVDLPKAERHAILTGLIGEWAGPGRAAVMSDAVMNAAIVGAKEGEGGRA